MEGEEEEEEVEDEKLRRKRSVKVKVARWGKSRDNFWKGLRKEKKC